MILLLALAAFASSAQVHVGLQGRWAAQARSYFRDPASPDRVAGLIELAGKADAGDLAPLSAELNAAAADLLGRSHLPGGDARLAALLQPSFFSLLTQENKDAVKLESRERGESLAAQREKLQEFMEAAADRLAWGAILDEKNALVVHESGAQKRLPLKKAARREGPPDQAARMLGEFILSGATDAAEAAWVVHVANEHGLRELPVLETAARRAASETIRGYAAGEGTPALVAARIAVLLHPRMIRLLNSLQTRRLLELAAGFRPQIAEQRERIETRLRGMTF